MTNTITKFNIALVAVFAVVVMAMPVVVNHFSVESATVFALGGNNGGDGGSGGSSGGTCCSTGGGDATPDPEPEPEPDPVPPICKYLNADDTSLPFGGGTVVLTWASERGTSATLSPDGSAVALNSSKPVTVTDDTTFVFRVVNSDGADTCQVHIDVEDQVVPSCDSFTVSSTNLPYGGGDVTLKWETTNATSVNISGIGAVAADNVAGLTRSVTQTTTFVLTATNVANSDTCEVTVTVGTPAPLSCADNVIFTANDYSLPYGGGDVTLSWDTTGLDAISITDVSNPAFDGNATVRVTDDKTYTLVATKDGRSEYCPLSIEVAERSGGSSGSSLRCDLDISDERINAGEEVTLEWNTTYADEITLEDNHGNILIQSDDSDDLDSSMKIRPTKDTTYTLTAEKGSRDEECEVEVEVEGGVTVTETRFQLPTVAGISLTQVPYTGFEAGPMLTTIFYALLTIWGLFVAYVVAVRRDMIGGVSLAGAHDHVPYTDVSSEAQADVSPVAQYVVAATANDVPANLPTARTPVIGYAAAAAMTEGEVDASIEMTELENRAHAQKALFSSDAMRYFTKVTEADERFAALDQLIAKAKAAFPSEDGWLVVNLARLESLLETNTAVATVAAEVTPGNGGSLAEAIVTGNIVAAYQLIAHRPMIALADAAAELDAVVRTRRGEVVSLSTMLANESARLTDAQLAAAIKALTSALDGVYTSEEEAVKMAIMKAVKAVV